MTIFEEQVVYKKENIHSNITWLINEIRVYSVWHLYELFTFYSQKVNEKVNFAILIINIVMSMNIMQQQPKQLLGLIRTCILLLFPDMVQCSK